MRVCAELAAGGGGGVCDRWDGELAYAELHCLSNFSFLRGASHPEELVARAAALGYDAIAITDRHSLAGIVRGHVAVKESDEATERRSDGGEEERHGGTGARRHGGVRLLIGAEVWPVDGPPLVLLAPDRAAYARLSRLLTIGKLRTKKGECEIRVRDLEEWGKGMVGIVLEESDGATERRSDEEKVDNDERGMNGNNRLKLERNYETPIQEDTSEGQNVSGFDCLAEGDGVGSAGLREHETDTGFRTVWADDSDAAGGRFDSIQHRRGARTAKPPRLHPISEKRARFADGIADANHTCGTTEVHHDVTGIKRTASRNGSSATRTHSRPGRSPEGDPPSLHRFVASSLSSPPPSLRRSVASSLSLYQSIFGPDNLFLAVEFAYDEPDAERLARLAAVSEQTGVPLVACNNVHYHAPERRYLQDVLTCIREKCTIAEAGRRLLANAERHLRPLDEIRRRYTALPDRQLAAIGRAAVARTVEIARRCTFSLEELRYEYPHEVVPDGGDAMEYLERLTWEHAEATYRKDLEIGGLSNIENKELSDSESQRLKDSGIEGFREQEEDREAVRSSSIPQSPSPFIPSDLIRHELALIRKLRYEHYFLTVYDIVRFARSRGILCQGRGSAANSAVCFTLGITAVDPTKHDLLFERFISSERNEPPDIDVDFEHERREEVFQYIYEKYGRERAAITAEVIRYRTRSAIRDVGKALGLSLDVIDVLAKQVEWFSGQALPDDGLRQIGLDPRDRTIRMLVRLVQQLRGFPRHLSQHVGGFVITETPLCEIVPLENGAMPGRTFIEWDKDDIDALGILKVDCLALGMLTAIEKCFRMLNGHKGTQAQRHEEEKENQTQWRRNDERGSDQNISGLDCLEKGNGAGRRGVADNESHARFRTVRPHTSDAPGRGLDREQHCRRERAAKPERLHSLPDHRARLVGGVGDAIDHRAGAGVSVSLRADDGGDARNSTDAPRPDHKPQEKGLRDCGIEGFGHEHAEFRACKDACVSSSQSLDPLIPQSLRDLPPEDPAVYDMICAADTVGVFQIESRAQMSMLPRLKPRKFYDLVIEVAIVRPGPIQGGMVHPFLRRRDGLEPVEYPSDAVKRVLHKTLGVPIFQEQVMRLAVVAAGFTPGEADQLRRSMAAWRRNGSIEKFQVKLIQGMLANGYSKEFAEQIYKQICGFGEYGFPESHSASFSLLVYASAWLKRYQPAAFLAAMINSQPLGFYTTGQLIRDAIEHGVEVRPVEVNFSGWDCLLEERGRRIEGLRDLREGAGNGERGTGKRGRAVGCRVGRAHHFVDEEVGSGEQEAGEGNQVAENEEWGTDSGARGSDPATWGLSGPAVRLGFRVVRGLSEEKVHGIVAAREDIAAKREATTHGEAACESSSIPQSLNPSIPIHSIRQLTRRGDISRDTLVRLAAADAFRSLGLSRRQALWEILGEEERHDGTEARRHEEEEKNAGKKRRVRTSLFAELEPEEPVVALPALTLDETVSQDYEAVGFSLNAHPMELVRAELDTLDLGGRRKSPVILRNRELRACRHRQRVAVAGLVTCRQRPGTAKGVVFMTLEDETAMANLVIWSDVWQRYKHIARGRLALIAEGRIERQGKVIHVMVERFYDLSEAIGALRHHSRDFH